MALAALFILLIAGAQPARAGTWMLVSCANPDGSVAPTDGWSAFTHGPVTVGDGNNTRCSPGVPMSAALGNVAPAQNGQSETLQFTPPAGSALVGGSLNVNLTAYGGNYSPPYGGATAQADILEPQDSLDQSNTVFSCINQFGCGGSGYAYSGAVTLPANRAGNLYVTAICTALGTFKCDTNIGGSNGYWALAQVSSAHLLLSNAAAPQATGFSGSALQRGARGVAHLVFTATDPAGPGIYAVTAAIDGRPVFSGTPNTNGGACVPVGTDGSGALMFDFEQPCPATEVVDVPVPTVGLPDGSHALAVTVTDAAHNSSTVLDQNITTSNPQTTPNPAGRRAIHARFTLSWRWNGAVTLLRWVRVAKLPRQARVAVRCAGRRCPRIRASASGPRRVARLLHHLGGRRFRAGQQLLITVTQAHHAPERIALGIRDGRKPLGRLVK
jgi:hypothetical protein